MTNSTPSGGSGDTLWGLAPPAEVPPGLESFPVLVAIPVQWGDQDAFGHVNNTVFFRWIESSRIAYCTRVGLYSEPESDATGGGSTPSASPLQTIKADLILAAASCDYRSPVVFPDTVVVGARTSRVGNSSITMEHAIYSMAQQKLAAEGKATIVYYDYAVGRSLRLPDPIRQAIDALEGRPLSG